MKWRLFLTPQAEALLRVLPPLTKRYVRQALDEILEDPWIGKALRDDLTGFHSFRTGRFRIVYQIHSPHRRLMVIGIGRRETIYEDIAAELRRAR